ncbi:MAG: hypothetical protein R2713_09560 [Ilumatobacteraceae bacterium]
MDATVAMVATAADGSNLTLDPDLDSFYLMDAPTTKTPTLLAAVGVMLDLEHLDPELHAEDLTIAQVRISDAVGAIEAGFAKTVGATADPTAAAEAEAAAAALRRGVRDQDDPGRGGYARLHDATISTADVSARNLRALVDTRIDGIVSARNTTLYVSAAAILLAIWLFAGVYQAIVPPIQRLREALLAAAKGDLTAGEHHDPREIGEMQRPRPGTRRDERRDPPRHRPHRPGGGQRLDARRRGRQPAGRLGPGRVPRRHGGQLATDPAATPSARSAR